MLWARAGKLVAQRLDVVKATLAGEPETVADGTAMDSVSRNVGSVAVTGLVAYRTATSGQRQLIWVDRSGATRGTLFDPDATLAFPSISPDGGRVALTRTVQGNDDLWQLDGTRALRFTFNAARDITNR